MSNVFPSLNNSSHSTILGLAINISHAVHGRIRSGAAGDRSFASSAKVVHWLHGLCLKMDISIKQMPFVHGKMMTSITLLSFQVLFSEPNLIYILYILIILFCLRNHNLNHTYDMTPYYMILYDLMSNTEFLGTSMLPA